MNKPKFSRARLDKSMSQEAEAYTSSIGFDRRLYRHDIAGSIAHARMLGRQGIITDKEAELVVMALSSIREEIEAGEFQFKPELEDIHMNVEARLIEKIGEAGRKLHTARSRNDQVALDMRLFTKEAVEQTLGGILALQRVLVKLAEEHKGIAFPGYTHLQPAQPILLAHHWLAYFEMLLRDAGRFRDCHERADVLPLGSGALAGVPYPVDREFMAKDLGFSQISLNSLDAVSDRDFVLEYEAAASIAMMHLSRLSEELVLWSSPGFGFVEIDEAYTTGSSIMPQKKNPDVAELARGKTGRVYGHLLGLLTTMKGLPLAYNRDLQEDKEGLFDTVDTLLSTLEVMSGMLGSLKVNAARGRQAAEEGYLLATDVADYLAKKGVPFRQAHEIVGRLVRYAMEQGKTLKQLSLREYRELSPLFDEDVRAISVESSLAARDVTGGTAPRQVQLALERAQKLIREVEKAAK